MLTRPVLLLRLEGFAVLVGAVWLYALSGASWGLFIVLLFAPDLTVLGYLAGTRAGAAAYNAAHTYASPALLAAAVSATGWAIGVPVALVWTAHIGLDRALGYGLKHPDSFHRTHLGSIGPSRHV